MTALREMAEEAFGSDYEYRVTGGTTITFNRLMEIYNSQPPPGGGTVQFYTFSAEYQPIFPDSVHRDSLTHLTLPSPEFDADAHEMFIDLIKKEVSRVSQGKKKKRLVFVVSPVQRLGGATVHVGKVTEAVNRINEENDRVTVEVWSDASHAMIPERAQAHVISLSKRVAEPGNGLVGIEKTAAHEPLIETVREFTQNPRAIGSVIASLICQRKQCAYSTRDLLTNPHMQQRPDQPGYLKNEVLEAAHCLETGSWPMVKQFYYLDLPDDLAEEDSEHTWRVSTMPKLVPKVYPHTGTLHNARYLDTCNVVAALQQRGVSLRNFSYLQYDPAEEESENRPIGQSLREILMYMQSENIGKLEIWKLRKMIKDFLRNLGTEEPILWYPYPADRKALNKHSIEQAHLESSDRGLLKKAHIVREMKRSFMQALLLQDSLRMFVDVNDPKGHMSDFFSVLNDTLADLYGRDELFLPQEHLVHGILRKYDGFETVGCRLVYCSEVQAANEADNGSIELPLDVREVLDGEHDDIFDRWADDIGTELANEGSILAVLHAQAGRRR